MPLFVDYGNVEDISYQLVLPSLAFSIITPLFIIARFVSRRVYMKSFGPDDWAILASLLYYYAQILYKLNINMTKVSILLLYIRVFGRPSWFTRTCKICIGIVVAFCISTVFASIFQCNPVEFAYNKKRPQGGSCIDIKAFWYANAAFNISTDFVIISLPTSVIRKLQLLLKTKVALCAVFALGAVVCITSILRVTTLDLATSNLDTPWTNVPSSMWTIIEINLGVICACLPTLWRPLMVIPPAILDHVKWVYEKRFSDILESNSANRRSRGSKATISSLVSGEPAGIRMQSLDRHGQHRDDACAEPTPQHSQPRTASSRFAGATNDGTGSQERIVVASVADEEDGESGQRSQIRKTTQVMVEYDD